MYAERPRRTTGAGCHYFPFHFCAGITQLRRSSMKEVNGMDGSVLSFDSLDSYLEEFRERGTALVPPNLIFSAEELEHLNAIQSCIQEERVSNGDAGDTHDIYVRRIMTDKPG